MPAPLPNRQGFIVRLDLPEGASTEDMRKYVADAVRARRDFLVEEDPRRRLNVHSIVVVAENKRRR